MDFGFAIEQLFHCAPVPDDLTCLQESGNNNDALGACFDHFRQIVQLDATDAKNRNANGVVNFRDLGQADRRIIGLGRCREDWAEPDVVGALIKRPDRLVDVVRGFANGAVRANDRARGGNRHVVLAEMNSCGADIPRDFGVIVDDQRNAAAGRDWAQFLAQLFDLSLRITFGAQLEKIDAGRNQRFGHLVRAVTLDITEIENPVKAAAAELRGSQADENYS